MQQIYYFILWLRPKQWIKNFIIFIPLIFSWNLFNFYDFKNTIIIFFIFSIFVGSTYIINDYFDIQKDKNHPTKKKRVLASWKLNKKFALFLAIFLILLNLLLSFYFWWIIFFLLFLAYLSNTFFYTIFTKNIVILDVFSIALGFVIRWLIWIFAIWAILSEWFLLIIFFWALLLGFLKRYQEVKLKIQTRKNIESYNEEFLKQIISMILSILLFIYTLYTFNSVQSKLFIFTLPIVVFAIIRYYYNIFFLEKYKNSIEDIIFKDKFILFSGIFYIIFVILIIYS